MAGRDMCLAAVHALVGTTKRAKPAFHTPDQRKGEPVLKFSGTAADRATETDRSEGLNGSPRFLH